MFVNVRKAPWSAKGDGQADDTMAIQEALEHAKEQGGGVVYLPAGDYAVKTHLVIPSGVELRGGYDCAHRDNNAGKSITVLLAYEGENSRDLKTHPAFISMKEDSGLVGVMIYYPNQNDFYPSIEKSPAKKYPWTIRGMGPHTYIRYVTIKRGWDLIDMASHDCSGFSMRGLWTAPLNRGIYVGGGTRGGRMEKIIQTMGVFAYPDRNTPDVPNWTRELEREWTWNYANEYFSQNVIGYLFGDVRDVQGLGVISFRLKHHMMFLPQDGQGPENVEFFLSPSEGTGDASCTFASGDQIRFYGIACATTVGPETILVTSDTFQGEVDVYGLITWGIEPRVRPEIIGGSLNIHPKAPAGTTTVSVTPDEGNGSIEVIYDSLDNTQKTLDTIMLSGSGTWKTWTREVDDAMFACSIAQPYRNDDLVFVTRTTKPLSVARVSITGGTVRGSVKR